MCLYVLSSVLWCSVRLYPQLFVEGLMSYLCYLSTFAYYVFKHILNILVTWQVSYKRQELLALPKHLSSPPDFGGVRVTHLFSFLRCVAFLCFVYLCHVPCELSCDCLWIVHSWFPLRISLKFLCLLTLSVSNKIKI